MNPKPRSHEFIRGMAAWRANEFAPPAAAVLLGMLTCLLCPGFASAAPPEAFLETYCATCHTGDDAESDFSMDDLLGGADFDLTTNLASYERIFEQLSKGKMPPRKKRQPAAEEKERMLAFLEDALSAHQLDSEGARDARPFRRRFNREEYQNTLFELLGMPADAPGFDPLVNELPTDTGLGGFDTVGEGLRMSGLHLELYLQLAERYLGLAADRDIAPRRWRIDFAESGSDVDRQKLEALRPGDRHDASGEQLLNSHFIRVDDSGADETFHDDFRSRINRARWLMTGKYGFPFFKDDVLVMRERFGIGKVYAREAGLYRYRVRCRAVARDEGLEHKPRLRLEFVGAPSAGGGVLRYNIAHRELPVNEWVTIDSTMFRTLEENYEGNYSGLDVLLVFEAPMVGQQRGETRPRADKERPKLTEAELRDHYRHMLEIDYVEIEGPIHPVRDPAKRIPQAAPEGGDEIAFARETLRPFLRRAFRRPVSDETVEFHLERFREHRAAGGAFADALEATLLSLLVSPEFLFVLNEPREVQPGDRLDPHALASRLSYFLWSAAPDTELSRCADDGSIRDPDTLRQQARRMIADPKSMELSRNFSSQWLHLRDIDQMEPDAELYKYDRELERSMVEETVRFFHEVLTNDLSILNFVDSDWTIVNRRLAGHYRLRASFGGIEPYQRVVLRPQDQRGGVLTQASVLKLTSNSTRTSPVNRGVFILENFLGDPPPPPPDNAGEIANNVPGLDRVTLRRQLELHRQLPECARCHDKIDPLGFALENYNAIGAWRAAEGHALKKRVNGSPIDARAVLPDGREIDGPVELKQVLLESPEIFAGCLTEKMLAYALGR